MSEKVIQTKFIAGRIWKPVTMTFKKNRIFFKFGFSRILIDEIKAMKGAKWHGFDKKNPRKVWSVPITERNLFAIDYLLGKNPYARYRSELKEIEPSRSLYSHQAEALNFMLTRRTCIYAGEMGVGKTLAAIEAMEHFACEGLTDWLWVGPRSALNAVKLEFLKWRAEIIPEFSTYASLHKIVDNHYDGIVFDECSRIKNPQAKRSINASILADNVRDTGAIILMSGSPAPKNPCDWWHLAEVAQPGYLREGNIAKLKKRLAIVEQRDSISGGVYPHLVAWRDRETICDICGEDSTHIRHYNTEAGDFHVFVPAKNEVKLLGKRLQGLVLKHLKKDCLDLPDKIYRVIDCEVSNDIKSACGIITSKAPTTIQALTLLRELSDGFQYKNDIAGTTMCDCCIGSGKIMDVDFEEAEKQGLDVSNPTKQLPMKEAVCTKCDGSGLMDRIVRIPKYIGTPKEQVLKDVLDEHSEVGRLVVSAAFRASIDKITAIVQEQGWKWIRIDGRGWVNNLGLGDQDSLKYFQEGGTIGANTDDTKVCVIMHPESGGMGLTLTASPSILIYSNDFRAESRIQLEDRIHRPGMDEQRGATIIDIDYLETDSIIRENLQQKRNLQSLSLDEIKNKIKEKRA